LGPLRAWAELAPGRQRDDEILVGARKRDHEVLVVAGKRDNEVLVARNRIGHWADLLLQFGRSSRTESRTRMSRISFAAVGSVMRLGASLPLPVGSRCELPVHAPVLGPSTVGMVLASSASTCVTSVDGLEVIATLLPMNVELN
jgi:hypothetical protein